METVQIVGGGQMGEALAAGLLAAAGRHEIRVVEPFESRADELRARYPDILVTDAVGDAAGTIVAVKPHHVEAVLASLSGVSAGCVLCVAAGVTIATLEGGLPAGTAVVRAMPNTPALIGAGAAAISPGTSASEADMSWARTVLSSVGIVVDVPEASLDAVTGLSGSGPAYVFLFLESLIDGGVAAGLPRDVATALAGQTLLGSARLFAEGDRSPADLRAAVTSPGGTTAAGLHALESAAVRAAILDAVAAATARSRELGRT